MRHFTDLRFLIGLFFFLTGLLLSIYAFVEDNAEGVNRWTGLAFLIFSFVMAGSVFWNKNSSS